MSRSVFISYRRDGGEFTGKVLYDTLRERGYNVFFDVESMNSGRFDRQIFDTIDKCESFILVLSKGALDRCTDPKDWVRREVEYAIDKHKNIIPVMLRGFTWPDDLCDSLKDLRYYEGVKASTDYWEASVDKICKFINSYIPPSEPEPVSVPAASPIAVDPPKTTAVKPKSNTVVPPARKAAKIDPLCIVALVLSVLLPPIGLVLSIIARKNAVKNKRRGGDLAFAGIVVGSVFTSVPVVLMLLGLIVGKKESDNTLATDAGSTNGAVSEEVNLNSSDVDISQQMTGEQFTGQITEQMLTGEYVPLSVYMEFQQSADPETISYFLDGIEGLSYTERLMFPFDNLASTEMTTVVPFSFRCGRITDFQSLLPNNADMYSSNVAVLDNTYCININYIDDTNDITLPYSYLFSIDDQNHMTCQRFEVSDEFTIVLDNNSPVEFDLSFVGDTLVVTASDGSEVSLISRQKNHLLYGTTDVYYLSGELSESSEAYHNISSIDIDISADGTASGSITFCDGSYPTQDPEIEFVYPNTITITWGNVYHPDTSVMQDESDSITFSFVGGDILGDGIVIIDEDGNTYDYGA